MECFVYTMQCIVFYYIVLTWILANYDFGQFQRGVKYSVKNELGTFMEVLKRKVKQIEKSGCPGRAS